MTQKALPFDNVEVGMELPTIVKHPTLKQLIQFAGASGDFHPMHYDDNYARSQGQTGVIVHGMLKCAWLSQLLTEWVGDRGTLKTFYCSYRGVDYPGDTVYCRGKVTEKKIENGEQLVACDVWTENQRGKKTTLGNALIALLPNSK